MKFSLIESFLILINIEHAMMVFSKLYENYLRHRTNI